MPKITETVRRIWVMNMRIWACVTKELEYENVLPQLFTSRYHKYEGQKCACGTINIIKYKFLEARKCLSKVKFINCHLSVWKSTW